MILMKNIIIREYKYSDFLPVTKLTQEKESYIEELDDMNRLDLKDDFGKVHVENLLNKTRDNGAVYVAEDKNKVIGCIFISIENRDEEQDLATYPETSGRVENLVIEENYRDHGIGSMLLDEAENFLKKKGCTYSRLEVFDPNTRAHELYERHGYQNRVEDMIKKL